jgi:type VI secretion system protein VasG
VKVGDREKDAREKLTAEKTGSRARGALEEGEGLVDQILELRAKLRGRARRWRGPRASSRPRPRRRSRAAPHGRRAGEAAGELHKVQDELHALQGQDPLILPTVDGQAVASVVGDWTGIPVGRMVKNEIETVLKLADTLNQRVIGQKHALEMIARRIQTSRAGLENPQKPIGVFMLAGTSGVGKTETALALAETLYGGEQNLITINMSEFQEAHTVSTLKGAPPGYVGYGEGGVLTEAVRRRPYSVVLLDEVEKAHPDVHEIFFQVFDKGFMEDGEGRLIDFKNTLIILTSNVGQRADHEHVQGPRAAAGSRGHRQGAARAAAEGLPGGAARAPGGHPLLPAQRRDDRQHRPAAAGPDQEAHRRQPQDPVHLRRRRW